MATYGYVLPTRGSVLSSDDAQTLAAKTAGDVIGLAGRAEAQGFDAVWVGDSVLAKPRHDPLSTLAAVAMTTEAVGLGTSVHLPPLRHPVHVAHRTATVDQLAGGRFRWGVGVGRGPAVEAEYANLGVPFSERGARLDELLEVVTELWRGESVDYSGTFYNLDGASIGFSPPREPPIYVATSAYATSESLPERVRRRLIEYGDGWLPIGLSPAAYGQALSALHESTDRLPGAIDPALFLDVVVDDERKALDTARTFYDRYYPSWGRLSDEALRDRGVFDTPANVEDAILAYQEAGVETFVVRFTAAEQRTQLRRFADLMI